MYVGLLNCVELITVLEMKKIVDLTLSDISEPSMLTVTSILFIA